MFEDDLKLILSFEGGYSNDPNDSGGETNKGITKATYDAYRVANKLPIQSVKEISDKEVSDIYYGYYQECGGPHIEQYDPKLATEVFDFAINAGSGQAVRTLQRLLGFTGPDIDGIFGIKTANSITFGGTQSKSTKYALARIAFYFNDCERKPSQKSFLLSWLSRPLKIEGLI